MTATIDKLGRLVVPKSLRDAWNLSPGTVLEIESDSEGLHFRLPEQGSALVRKEGFLVHHGREAVDLNIVDFLRKERDGRGRIGG